jgi:hypothetical protein
MTYLLLYDPEPLGASASHLARHGAQVRQERSREVRKAFHRDLRARLGLPAAEALKITNPTGETQ